MSLPPGIRLQILRNVLCVGKIDPWDHSRLGPLTPGLLSLNQDTGAAAREIFYGENCFDLRVFKSDQTATFIRTIGSNAKRIKVVHIDVNVCPDASRLDQDSIRHIDLLRESCENLKKVIVSMPEHGGLDAQAAPHVVSTIRNRFDNEISIYSEGHNDTQTLPVKMEIAKKRVIDQYSGLTYQSGCLQCLQRESSCDKHSHLLEWIATTPDFNALFCRQIYLMILRDAKDMKEIRHPNRERTIISASGKLRHVEWEDFSMNIFNDPKPTNALQATLGMVLADMISYTERKSQSLGYGKFAPDSREVFSRRDIQSTFLPARTLDVEGICQQIKSIRILDFIKERNEYEKDEEDHSQSEDGIARKSGKGKRVKAGGEETNVGGRRKRSRA